VGLGFVALGMFQAAVAAADLATSFTAPANGIGWTVFVVGWATNLVAVTFALLVLSSRTRAPPEDGRVVNFVLVVLAVAAATGILAGLWNPGLVGNLTTFRLLNGLWRLALPVFVTYALVKLQLFELQSRMRLTVKASTVGAVFVAVFFVVAQLTEGLLQKNGNLFLGAAATGLLLFAISPIQRIAERVAVAAVPSSTAGPGGPPVSRKADVYRAALRMALANRVVSRDEERSLADLAAELGIDASSAFRLREDVERELGVEPAGAEARKKRKAAARRG
jgi:hypothetical protein